VKAHAQGRSAALEASNRDGAGVAAYFLGEVQVRGAFVVTAGTKSVSVPHPDGSHRLLYCMESPENWFEDFGESELRAGEARVGLDADFAAVVQTAGYHVFLTPRSDSNGLYVARQDAAGFTVREQRGGQSDLTFSYRVVARRKDIEAPRLPKHELHRPSAPNFETHRSSAGQRPHVHPIPRPSGSS
jgi:hypothetical protein